MHKKKKDENFKDTLTRLRVQTSCFKLVTIENELLCNRVVVGIAKKNIPKNILSDPDVTLGLSSANLFNL